MLISKMMLSKLYFASALFTSQVAQMVKNLPTMQETQVQSLGQEDSLEKITETHSSILAISFYKGSSQPRYRTCVSCIVGRFFTD